MFVPISIVFAILLFKKGDVKEKFLSVLFFEELGLRLFYFSAFLHYNVLLLMLSIMIFAIYVGKYFKLKDGVIFIFMAYILFSLGYIYKNAYLVEKKRMEHKINYEYVFENTNFCDYVINGYYAVYNLKSKDPGFYSILLGQIDVLGDKLNIAPKDNLNELIVKYKPKINFIDKNVFFSTRAVIFQTSTPHWQDLWKASIPLLFDNICDTTYPPLSHLYISCGFRNFSIYDPDHSE